MKEVPLKARHPSQPFDPAFFSGKRFFVTGHTGFKGSWLCLWLQSLGGVVTGYALNPPTKPSLFEICRVDEFVNSTIADVRDSETLTAAMIDARPDIVVHMAAQPLVRESYNAPAETFEINVMGTVNLFEAVRKCRTVRAVLNITSDKCYENREWVWGYRETEALGGFDPYSSSKACSELITSAYRNSFFPPGNYNAHGVGVASARAGNVIGGGDWAAHRLLPDCVRSVLKGETIVIRNAQAVRPWQHVLEPLSGYIMLAQRLCEDGPRFSQAWNFGPDDRDARPVEWLVKRFCTKWGGDVSYTAGGGIDQPHEAHHLKLDSSKARIELGWYPRWNLERAVDCVVEWTGAYAQGKDMKTVCLKQIADYMSGRAEG